MSSKSVFMIRFSAQLNARCQPYNAVSTHTGHRSIGCPLPNITYSYIFCFFFPFIFPSFYSILIVIRFVQPCWEMPLSVNTLQYIHKVMNLFVHASLHLIVNNMQLEKWMQIVVICVCVLSGPIRLSLDILNNDCFELFSSRN